MQALAHKQQVLAGKGIAQRSAPCVAHSTRGRTLVPALRAQANPNGVEPAPARRNILVLGTAGVIASGLSAQPALAAGTGFLEVDQLSTFQRADQKSAYKARVEGILREELDGNDSPLFVRLALHDAGTYDAVTKTGGFDGSIAINNEELSRPENKGLAEAVNKLKVVKKRIDEQVASGPISWADLIYLAGKISTQKKWFAEKTSKPEVGTVGGETIAKQFPNPWSVEIGRVDSNEPGPLRVPPLDADVEEIRTYLLKLGAKPDAGSGPLTPKPPFWEKPGFLIWTASASDPAADAQRLAAANPKAYEGVKKNYDRSKNTYTRTDYEVDFAAVYNKLCNLGAKFNSNAYLSRVPVTRIV